MSVLSHLSPFQVAFRIVSSEPPPVASAPLQGLCERFLRKAPEQRPTLHEALAAEPLAEAVGKLQRSLPQQVPDGA